MSNKKNNNWLERLQKLVFPGPKDKKSLLDICRDGHAKGLIDLDALAMVEGVFQVTEMRVRDIMVPRTHMVVVQENMTIEGMLPLIANSGHSRFPVVDEGLDEIVGILLAKDLTHYNTEKSRKDFELKDILRPAIFVPESKRLNVLLKDFRTSRNHMAVVVDEYGGVSGLVTIEDVLEQIVGEIDDEHDAADVVNIRRYGFHRYNVRGLTPIEDFNSYFDVQLKTDKFDTIAGLVTNELGHLPVRGEEVAIEHYLFKVISANSRRINSLQVSLLPEDIQQSSAV